MSDQTKATEVYIFDLSPTRRGLPVVVVETAQWAESVASTHRPLRAIVSGRDCLIFRENNQRRDEDIKTLEIFWQMVDNPSFNMGVIEKSQVSPYLLLQAKSYAEYEKELRG